MKFFVYSYISRKNRSAAKGYYMNGCGLFEGSSVINLYEHIATNNSKYEESTVIQSVVEITATEYDAAKRNGIIG